MSGHINDLHPAPNAEVLAEMEMQPEHYDVVARVRAVPRADPDEVPHARAAVVVAFGKTLSHDEINAVMFDTIATLHAFLEGPGLRLDYQPGHGDGPTPPDTAVTSEPMHLETTPVQAVQTGSRRACFPERETDE